MSNEPLQFVGLTAEEARIAMRDFMDGREGNILTEREKQIVHHGKFLGVQEDEMGVAYEKYGRICTNRTANFIGSHDTLNRLLDVLTPKELKKMGDYLYGHWLNKARPSTLNFEDWLIKRDLHAFVCAVLVAVGAGKES